MLYRRVLLLGLVALFCVTRPAAAEDIPAYKLQMQTDPTLPNGKVRIIEGTAGARPDRFFLEDLGVLQPIAVTLIAQKPGDEIQIAFSKDRWDEVVEKHVTSATEDELVTKLRTQGTLQMEITSATGPKPYWLVVWVGDEVKPDLAPVTVPMSQYTKEHPEAAKAPAAAGGTSPVMIVIAVALVVIVLLLAVIAFRKKGRS